MENKFTNSGDILVKVDQNNLIYIDPNTVVSNGEVQQRQVDPENLVIYVNLEADLVPRTTLISGNETNALTSIARGTLNFLQPPSGKDYDTTWTDSFINTTEKRDKDKDIDTPTTVFDQYDKTAQTFGIDNVSIRITGTNFIPQISIKFIDVRGKTMFESPKNSPYKAFFHLPWPIFYLTVKGYYGKAIRYRLHMVKFNSAFNSSTGNFDIDTVFVGSTYAFLNDIPLSGILNAPYLFGVSQTENSKFNESTGYYEKTLKNTSVGYVTLKSVYDEYKSKGLLAPNFPVKTLREVAVIARRLDKILESEVFNMVVDPKILMGVKNFEDTIQGFYNSVNFWGQKYLSSVEETIGSEKYRLLADINKNSLEHVVGKGKSGTLEEIIDNYTAQLKGNQAFGIQRDETLIKDEELEIAQIKFDGLQTIGSFYKQTEKVLVNYNKLISIINNIRRDFVTERTKLEQTLQKKMNETVKDPNKGFGFEPTIRNIIGVVLANADTYIRLLKDVHIKAFNQAGVRKEILNGILTDSIGDDNIYPWPEIKKTSASEKQNVLVYPGSESMVEKLKTNNYVMWPEVGFIEEYYSASTFKTDPLSNKDGLNLTTYVFESNTDELGTKDLSTFTNISGVVPYYNKSISSILYEIWERARYVTALESFDVRTIQELAGIEFDNIKNQIGNDYTAVGVLSQQASTGKELRNLLYSYSPFERWSYIQDYLSTVPYITDTLSNSFGVEKYAVFSGTTGYGDTYKTLNENLFNYESEDYRKRIYPFNSTTYKTYLSSGTFGKNELNLHGILGLTTNNGFITSPIDLDWVKSGYATNLFTQDITISGETRQIVNTPYFHKQLLSDFNNSKITGKYASSAYLLLNSLPFKDLDDTIKFNGEKVLMSTMFREIGASHFIPYHLMLKWGSIYHRYKTEILYNEDIIDDITDPINTDIFFDNNYNRTYTIDNVAVNKTNENNIGLYPFYQSVFHQIIHDYTFYDPTSVSGNTQYDEGVIDGNIVTYKKDSTDGISWTSFVNNSKYDNTQSGYTFLPSNGVCEYDSLSDYLVSEQDNLRVLWDSNFDNNQIVEYSGQTFPTYDQYFKGTNNTYSLSANNKKVIDLIATFHPDILDTFEQAFLDFSSVILDDEIQYLPYDVKYYSFQTLLKDITYISSTTTDALTLVDKQKFTKHLISNQNQRLLDITKDMLGNDSLIKLTLGNPKEIDTYNLYGFTRDDTNFDVGNFATSQVTQENLNYIRLYLGEDMDSYYLNFFSTNDIALNDTNIKNFRHMIYTYGGAMAAGTDVTNTDVFISYLTDNIVDNTTQRMDEYLKKLTPLFKDLKIEPTQKPTTYPQGYNEDSVKLELYDYFKSFNDKWVAGNSLGNRTLMEEFLFIDKANRDIGDEVYLSMDRLVAILAQKDYTKVNLFSLINLLIKNSGFDLRPLPAYVNFYGANFGNTKRTTPSKTVAKNLFGSFLEVDYQESSPKILLQYTGPLSKHLEMSDIDKDSKFQNDTFDISMVNNNPLVIAPDVFRNVDFSKSNKAVAFEVSFGDQAQSQFKGLELNQNTIRNTTESFYVLEQLAASEAGTGTAQVDIGLFDIYRTASYSCTVMAMGNVMIQPTMFFYLKNVPMFRGSYWITEVNHTIRNNGIETSFTGSRIPMQSLPNPEDSFLASYRAMFDIITNRAIAKVKQIQSVSGTTSPDESFVDPQGVTYPINMSGKKFTGETLILRSGVREYGIPYNGYNGEKYVQLVENGGEWLRGSAVQMGTDLHPIKDDISMKIITNYGNIDGSQTKVTWGDIKGTADTHSFYACRFINKYIFRQYEVGSGTYPNTVLDEYPKTEFKNPANPSKTALITTNFNHATSEYDGPVQIGPAAAYGITMSAKLMKDLDLSQGDIVYFRLRS